MKLVEIKSKFKSEFDKFCSHFKHQGIWVLIGRIYLMIGVFVISIILTKNFSPSSYGEYKYYISILALFSIFSLPESFQIIIRYVLRGHTRVLIHLTRLRLKFTVATSLVLFFIALFKYFINSNFELYLLIAVFLPFYYSYDLYVPFLQAKMNFKLLNVFLIIRISIQIILIYLAVLLFKSPIVCFLALIISFSSLNFIFYNYVKYKYNIEPYIYDKRVSNLFIKQTIFLSIVGILPILIENFDKIVIAKYFDYSSLAYFSLGLMIGKAVNGFFKPFLTTFSAKLVFNKMSVFHCYVIIIIGTMFGLMISIYIIPPLLLLIYGSSYENSIIYSQIIVSSLGLYIFHSLYYNQAMFNKNLSLNSIYLANTFTPIALIGLLFLIVNLNFSTNQNLILICCLYPTRMIFSLIVLRFSQDRQKLLKSILS